MFKSAINDPNLMCDHSALIDKVMLALMRAVSGLFEFRGRCFESLDLLRMWC